jgi:uncharacterized protein (TIGR02246 family)
MRWLNVMAAVGGIVTVSGLASLPCAAQAPNPRAEDERAIRAAAQQYVAALEAGDADALAAFWTPEGDYVDEHGRSHPASELVAEAARSKGQGLRPQIKLLENRIRFLTDEVAIEDGTSEAVRPDAASRPSRGRFSAIWVKRDGKWRLASLREARIDLLAAPPRLADLAWMLGQWSATSGDTLLEVSARWNATETFLLRDLKVTRGGKVVFQASQRIGWDPLTKRVKSWIFDSDGGYGEATWLREGERWLIESTGVLPDGRQTAGTSTLTQDGENAFTWRSSGARIDGEPGAGLEIQFTRKTAP